MHFTFDKKALDEMLAQLEEEKRQEAEEEYKKNRFVSANPNKQGEGENKPTFRTK